MEADFQSRTVRNSSKLDPKIFHTICRKWSFPTWIFCFHNFSLGPNIRIMEVGSIQQGKGRFLNNLDPSKRICFSLFCINRSSLEQSTKGESNFVANYHSLANAIMISTTVTTNSANTITSTKNSEPFIRSKQRKASLDRAGKLTTPSMGSRRKITCWSFGRFCRSYHKCKMITYKCSLRISSA